MNKTIKMLRTASMFAFVFLLGTMAQVFAETPGQYIDDATISTKVRAGFLGDTHLQGARISVETDRALVHLTGLVNTRAQADEAERIARHVNGVRSVQDNLVLRNHQS